MTQQIEQVCFDSNIEPLDPSTVHQVALLSGKMMPVAAYGTFHSDWAQAYMKDATVEAIRLGWRHLDTARAYENEDVVGEAIREAIKLGYIDSADDLFITGKLWNGHMDPKDVQPALDATLQALGVEKLDMYLNHWPWPNVHTPGCCRVITGILMRFLISMRPSLKPGKRSASRKKPER
jgi:alcohol dehydrogenase (NADP+)